MRVVWLSDLHLNFVEPEEREAFYAAVRIVGADVALLSGDLAESPELEAQLRALREGLGCPLAFVLGNHDFYAGGIAATRALATRLTAAREGLAWLPATGILRLGADVAATGHDGWADGRAGDWETSAVALPDDHVIDEMAGDREHVRRTVRAQAEAAADWARVVLPQALAQFAHVLFVTHVPPFAEAVRIEDDRDPNAWLPRMASPTLGEALVAIADAHPARRITVLCGHTHAAARWQARANLEVRVAGATVGRPGIQHVFDFDDIAPLAGGDAG